MPGWISRRAFGGPFLFAVLLPMVCSFCDKKGAGNRESAWKERTRLELEKLTSFDELNRACRQLGSIHRKLGSAERSTFRTWVGSHLLEALRKFGPAPSKCIMLVEVLWPPGSEEVLKLVHETAFSNGWPGPFVSSTVVLGNKEVSRDHVVEALVAAWITGSSLSSILDLARKIGCQKLAAGLARALDLDHPRAKELLERMGIFGEPLKDFLVEAAARTASELQCFELEDALIRAARWASFRTSLASVTFTMGVVGSGASQSELISLLGSPRLDHAACASEGLAWSVRVKEEMTRILISRTEELMRESKTPPFSIHLERLIRALGLMGSPHDLSAIRGSFKYAPKGLAGLIAVSERQVMVTAACKENHRCYLDRIEKGPWPEALRAALEVGRLRLPHDERCRAMSALKRIARRWEGKDSSLEVKRAIQVSFRRLEKHASRVCPDP